MTSGIFVKWWLRTESNRRHEDFQSSALPTELQSRGIFLNVRENKLISIQRMQYY